MRKSKGKIESKESGSFGSQENRIPNLNDGNPADSSPKERETQMTLPVDLYLSTLPDLRCFSCHRESNEEFEKILKALDLLPPFERLAALMNYRNALDVSYSLHHHRDYISVLDKMIAIYKVKLEEEQRNQKPMKSNDDDANRMIHPDAFKLELDLDEGELAEMAREFILTARNKKLNQVYRDSNVKFAQWICNSIMLTNRQELNYLTILKGLSKIAHPKKQRGIDQD